ncbi:DUF305 domain-containing protein [Streptomyces sp. NPDC000983]|uniref:DUF305 domain-containing protein n=1 Tax=Streptomyces sp. NPDC000983 TaxID=3154373 RepID=UPI003321C2E7
MNTVKRGLVAAGLVAGVLLVSACGGESHEGAAGMDHGGSASAPAPDGGFNDADVAFAQMMIPHHEQALEMAELADGRAADPEVEELAGKIERAQDPEIETMRGWLKSWKQPTSAASMPGMDHGSGHGSGHGGDGMMSASDMAELKGLKGAAFDRAFAEMMIEHHDGAIAMAEDLRRDGENADAKRLAAAVVKGQSAEVEQLRDLLDRL